MPAPKPTRAPFAFFDCPKCRHQSTHAWTYTRSFQTYAWCEGCSSYFQQHNAILFGMLWGGGLAPLLMLLVMEGPLAPWRPELGLAPLMLLAAVVVVPILAFTLPYFVRWTIRYEYMGRNAP